MAMKNILNKKVFFPKERQDCDVCWIYMLYTLIGKYFHVILVKTEIDDLFVIILDSFQVWTNTLNVFTWCLFIII